MSLLPTLFVLKVTAMAFAVVCLIANSLVCHVIVRVKAMKTPINYIILNLAILDAMNGAFTIFKFLINDKHNVLGANFMERAYNQSPSLAEALCVTFDQLYWHAMNTSPLILTIMAYERYKAIAHPLSRIHGGITKAKLKWMLPLASLIGFGFTCVDMATVRYDNTVKTCTIKDYGWYNEKAYAAVFLIGIYAIPSTAMFVLYVLLICALRRQDNALGPQAEAQKARRKARKKVMWIIVVVTLVFYICAGLPAIFYLVFTLSDISFRKAELYLYDITCVLYVFNSAFNPLVYFISLRSFRNGFKHAFGIRRSNISFSNPGINTGSKRSVDITNTVSACSNEPDKSNRKMRIVGLKIVIVDE